MSYLFILAVMVGVAILVVVLVLGLRKRDNETKMAIEKERKLNWLNIASILCGVIGILSICPAGIVIYFSHSSFAPWNANYFFIFSVISFPIVCIGSSLGIWYLKNKNKILAFYVFLLPVIPLILIYVGSNWMSLASCGKFDCRTSSMQEQDNATQVGKCALPALDGGDSLKTTGCGVLILGVNATGTINSTSEAHNWRFTVQNNNRITIIIEHHSNSCSQISVLDSKGRVIESFKDENKTNICSSGMPSSMTTTSLYYFNPPNKGTYILRIIAPQVPSDYWLKIE